MPFLIALVASLIALGAVTWRLRTALTQLREARDALATARTHDPLTKLPSRALFVRHLEEALAERGTGAVLILDIERLPLVNDILGHDVGDGVLLEIADRLRASVRDKDLVARLSGGEFVVLLQTQADVDLLAIGERLLELCRVDRPSPQGTLSVGAKVGMVQWDESTEPTSGAELLRAAERAMHAEDTAAAPPPAPDATSRPAPATAATARPAAMPGRGRVRAAG